LAVLQHTSFHTRARDMGIYAQILWNASQGRGLASTLLMENTNHLAEHVAPVLWLIAPIYGLAPNPAALVILQQLFLAASGIPVFFWARRVLNQDLLALLVLTTYLAMPAMSRIALSEFHPVVMAALPAATAAYGVFTGQTRITLIGVGLCLFMEEETALVIAGLGMSWLVMHRQRWPVGAALIGIALTWAILVAFVIMPAFQHRVSREAGNRATGHYEDVQKDPLGTIGSYATQRTSRVAEWLVLPNAGLSLVSPHILLAAMPTTLMLFLQDRADTYGGHWAGAMMPLFGMATASGLARLRQFSGRLGWIGAAVLAIVASGTYLVHSHFPGGRDFEVEKFSTTQVEHDLAEAVRLVPAGTRVTASRRVVPHLAHRPEVWQFPPSFYASALRPDAARQDAYIFDLTDSPTRRALEDLNGDTVLTRRPRLHLRQFGDSVLLLTRDQPAPTALTSVTFPGVVSLGGFDLEQTPGEVRLRAYWEPLGRSQREVVRLVRLTDDAGLALAERQDIPLQALLPPTRWERGQTVAEQVSLPLPAGYRGTFRILVGWRETIDGVPLRSDGGADLVEIYR
ncbi:MAG: DUF2079 domain-containing protein, partial [Chloroflexota bacterium]